MAVLEFDDAEFRTALAYLGPFEDRPSMAAALSGGPDSLALATCLYRWIEQEGGELTLLHIDHRLRPNSSEEASWLGRQAARLMPKAHFHILPWLGDKPLARVQEKARQARYALLTSFCRQAGIFHLCLGHQADDQRETVAMRAQHGSGDAGLAGMSALHFSNGVRLLRPLLAFPKERLKEFLRARDIPWLEDPSNQSSLYARTAFRQPERELPFSPDILTTGRKRCASEVEITAYLVQNLTVKSEGYFEILNFDGTNLPLAARALALASLSLSARPYAPPFNTMKEILRNSWDKGSIGSLGHCLWQRKGNSLLIAKEAAACSREQVKKARFDWDSRFVCSVSKKGVEDGLLSIGPLGDEGLINLAGKVRLQNIPTIARSSLPALFRGREIVAVPFLGWGDGLECRFRCDRPVSPALFTLALEAAATI